MGTTLTGTTPQDTYDSLIKVTDNGPLSATGKYLSDGLGNDSVLALSTSRVGIGTATPAYNLHINAASDSRIIITDSAQGSTANDGTYIRQSGVNSSIVNQENGTLQFGTNNSFVQTILANGNVGIGTSTPFFKLDVDGSVGLSFAGALYVYYIDATNHALIGNDGSGNMTFATGTSGVTEKARITTDGYLRLATNGIQFNGDTAAANALDDYEEGTWTMGVSFGGASVGVTYSNSTGTYTKIGRQVTVNGLVELTNKGTSTGLAAVSGLPFPVGSLVANYGAASVYLSNITFLGQFMAFAISSESRIRLRDVSSLGVIADLNEANFANNSTIMVNFTYFV